MLSLWHEQTDIVEFWRERFAAAERREAERQREVVEIVEDAKSDEISATV